MNIAPLLVKLSEKQRAGFIACVSKIQSGKKINQHDIEALTDDNSCSGLRIQRAFNISKMGLNRWCDEGCPRNNDGTYSIADIYKWRKEKADAKAEDPNKIKENKLLKETELLEARITKMKDQYIERSLYETIEVSRASSLRIFLEKTFMANAVHLAGKTVDEVRTILYRLAQAAMDAYSGNTISGN